MPAITKYAKKQGENLYEQCYEYLNQNFHRFKDSNKIKISIDVMRIFNKDGSKSLSPAAIIQIVSPEGVKNRLTEILSENRIANEIHSEESAS